jgi:hypothetical protein
VAQLLLAVAGLAAGGATALSVADPRCEGLREAPQVDTPAPRFSWRLVAEGRDVRQTAYQLRVTAVDARERPLGASVESARLESDETQWVALPGFAAKPRATYAWQVRAWDNHGNASELDEATLAPVSSASGGPPTGSAMVAPSRSSRRRLPATSAAHSRSSGCPSARGST